MKKMLSHGRFANAARPAGNFVANNGLAFWGNVGKPCDVVAACLTVGRLGDGRSNKVRVTIKK